ncbi:hypothetical protein K7432_007081 [Basidiobolus ranarum]|uniref:Uncharacterized protein n=1 Tax=Basidiobolus ranarum TaxID=34480 RepID=A0ABR2WTX1_9FUNG
MFKLSSTKSFRKIRSFRDETTNMGEQFNGLINKFGFTNTNRGFRGEQEVVNVSLQSQPKATYHLRGPLPKFDEMLGNEKTLHISLTPTVAL